MDAALRVLMIAMGASLALNVGWHALRIFSQQRRLSLSADTLSGFCREWAAAIWMIVGAPLALLPHRPAAALSELDGHPPVLLIPGYGLTRVMMWPLAAYLRRRGRWVWAINNPIHEDDIPTFAAHAAACADALRERTGADQIDIVGHSMGGIVAAYYIAHLGGKDTVRRLVTLGTPWQGTRVAALGLGRQSRALQPGSPVLASLEGFQHDTVALWSSDDCIVLPTPNAIPPHARAVELDRIGHLEMIHHSATMRAVRDALAAP